MRKPFVIKLFSLILTIFSVQFVYSQHRFGCDDDYCDKIYKEHPCKERECKDGRLEKNATTCGCCDICIKSLKEGDDCKTLEIGSFPTEECGDGLICDPNTKRCVPSKCLEDKLNYELALMRGAKLHLKPEPECDYFGFYKPVACVSDTICFCVDKNGKRIFGMDAAKNRKFMDCNCSRDYNEFPKEVRSGNFLRCLPNGNYDSLQCTEKWCYCMGSHKDRMQFNTSIEDLLCYDQDRHKGDDNMLRSKCQRERNSILQQISKNYGEKGIQTIGVDIPTCDLDGSYAPVQCKKNSCYCVKRNGAQMENGFKINRNSKEIRKMTCSCLREKELLHAENVNSDYTKYECDRYGNYKM